MARDRQSGICRGAFPLDLILIRHARAFDRDPAAWPDDSRRPLTAQGREEFRVLAKRLGRAVREVDLLESSSYVRAWQTAQIVSEETAWPKPSRLERLEAAEGSGDEQIEALVRVLDAMRGIETVAWVGHEPMLSRLASRLLTGSPDGARIDFKKGAAVALRVAPSARAEMLWMITPRLITRMRRGGK
jgi:phosphohistidine phosphatase